MSLPQRFRLATASGPADASSGSPLADTTAASAQRVLVLAEEGLDMMMQVSRVVNDTLVSAESWCQRLRMPRNSGDADATSGAGAAANAGAGTGAGTTGAPVMTQAQAQPQTTAPAQSAPPVPAGDIKLPIVAPMQHAYTPQDIEMAE
ncbi:hypothetical protein KEM55_001815 [Ascosphaera atra]|nr:hypothetical protein KEM55_001815 [Ascosphaera atra]